MFSNYLIILMVVFQTLHFNSLFMFCFVCTAIYSLKVRTLSTRKQLIMIWMKIICTVIWIQGININLQIIIAVVVVLIISFVILLLLYKEESIWWDGSNIFIV